MPVTIKTAPHDSNEFYNESAEAKDAPEFFSHDSAYKRFIKIVGSSFDPRDTVYFKKNGFLNTVLDAYNNHYHLTIRPDDVWISILSQLSCYINAFAEELRSKFVAHEGKNELRLEIPPSSVEDIDFDSLSSRMVSLLNENLVDKSLEQWILPNFSTTTQTDTTVSAITMMASMKAYFEYTAYMRCGIPTVTLDGDKQDWTEIRQRLSKLDEFGDTTKVWASMMKPVITKFIAAFDGEVDSKFWGHIASPVDMGSGTPTIGGWITAFCAIDEEGKLTGPGSAERRLGDWNVDYKKQTYCLEGINYPIIDQVNIPAGRSEVDLKIVDLRISTVYQTVMIAGNMGMKVTPNREGAEGKVQNTPMWYIGLIKVRALEAKDNFPGTGDSRVVYGTDIPF